MKLAKLEGVLMDNKEFICQGKSMFLSDEQIAKFIEIVDENKKENKEITIDNIQLQNFCRSFHKWFRVADCKNNADVDMYKAIEKLDENEYGQAITDALAEIGIRVK